MYRLLIAALAAGSFCGPAFAQVAAPGADPAYPPPPVTAAAGATIPKGASLSVRITEPLDSHTYKTGDLFKLELAEPLMLGDRVIIPAGAPGVGQVVHAAPKGFAGKAGELLLAARYLDYQGQHIPLKGFQLSGGGRNLTAVAFWAGPFLKGGETYIPVGAGGPAKLGADLVLDAEGAILPLVSSSDPKVNP